MSREPEKFSIWFFIGSLILIYGILIFAAGIRPNIELARDAGPSRT